MAKTMDVTPDAPSEIGEFKLDHEPRKGDSLVYIRSWLQKTELTKVRGFANMPVEQLVKSTIFQMSNFRSSFAERDLLPRFAGNDAEAILSTLEMISFIDPDHIKRFFAQKTSDTGLRNGPNTDKWADRITKGIYGVDGPSAERVRQGWFWQHLSFLAALQLKEAIDKSTQFGPELPPPAYGSTQPDIITDFDNDIKRYEAGLNRAVVLFRGAVDPLKDIPQGPIVEPFQLDPNKFLRNAQTGPLPQDILAAANQMVFDAQNDSNKMIVRANGAQQQMMTAISTALTVLQQTRSAPSQLDFLNLFADQFGQQMAQIVGAFTNDLNAARALIDHMKRRMIQLIQDNIRRRLQQQVRDQNGRLLTDEKARESSEQALRITELEGQLAAQSGQLESVRDEIDQAKKSAASALAKAKDIQKEKTTLEGQMLVMLQNIGQAAKYTADTLADLDARDKDLSTPSKSGEKKRALQTLGNVTDPLAMVKAISRAYESHHAALEAQVNRNVQVGELADAKVKQLEGVDASLKAAEKENDTLRLRIRQLEADADDESKEKARLQSLINDRDTENKQLRDDAKNAVGLLALPSRAEGSLEAEIKQLREEIKKKNDDLSVASKELLERTTEVTEAKAAQKAAERQSEDAKGELAPVQSQLEDQKKISVRKDEQIKALEKDIADLRSAKSSSGSGSTTAVHLLTHTGSLTIVPDKSKPNDVKTVDVAKSSAMVISSTDVKQPPSGGPGRSGLSEIDLHDIIEMCKDRVWVLAWFSMLGRQYDYRFTLEDQLLSLYTNPQKDWTDLVMHAVFLYNQSLNRTDRVTWMEPRMKPYSKDDAKNWRGFVARELTNAMNTFDDCVANSMLRDEKSPGRLFWWVPRGDLRNSLLAAVGSTDQSIGHSSLRTVGDIDNQLNDKFFGRADRAIGMIADIIYTQGGAPLLVEACGILWTDTDRYANLRALLEVFGGPLLVWLLLNVLAPVAAKAIQDGVRTISAELSQVGGRKLQFEHKKLSKNPPQQPLLTQNAQDIDADKLAADFALIKI